MIHKILRVFGALFPPFFYSQKIQFHKIPRKANPRRNRSAKHIAIYSFRYILLYEIQRGSRRENGSYDANKTRINFSILADHRWALFELAVALLRQAQGQLAVLPLLLELLLVASLLLSQFLLLLLQLKCQFPVGFFLK